MKKLSFLLLCLGLLAAACQKTHEPREEVSEEPVIFEQSVQCQPIACADCADAIINPSCCCQIVVHPPVLSRPCLDLCGTSSPLMPESCRIPCQVPPPTNCSFPIGPIHESVPSPMPGIPHVYCAAVGHAYRIMNCGTSTVTFDIICGTNPPLTVTLLPGQSRFYSTNAACRPTDCPQISPEG